MRMIGPSLLGISQWLTAKKASPHLKAIVPAVACGDCYGKLWYPGGMRPGTGREARKLSPGAEVEFATAIQHPDFESWWSIRTTLADAAVEIGKRGVAVSVAGGRDDYISPANIRLHNQLGADAHKRLFFGSYARGWHTQFFQELQVQWLDRWLKGEANGVDTAAKAMLSVKGADRRRLEDDWPLPDAHATRLYFSDAHSGSIDSLNDGELDARASTSGMNVALPYKPDYGPFPPVLLSATKGRSKADQRRFDQKVATWATAPLSVATEVTGYPRVTIWAASSTADARRRLRVHRSEIVQLDATERERSSAVDNRNRTKGDCLDLVKCTDSIEMSSGFALGARRFSWTSKFPAVAASDKLTTKRSQSNARRLAVSLTKIAPADSRAVSARARRHGCGYEAKFNAERSPQSGFLLMR